MNPTNPPSTNPPVNASTTTESDRQEYQVPGWALTALQREIPTGAHVLNAMTVEKGRMKGAVLANTTVGAVLISKSRFGEPNLTLLALPGRVVSFRCRWCGEENEAHDPVLPRTLYCASCAEPHAVDVHGKVFEVPGREPGLPGSRARPPTVQVRTQGTRSEP